MREDKEGAASAGSCSCALSRAPGLALGHRWVVAEQGMAARSWLSQTGEEGCILGPDHSAV